MKQVKTFCEHCKKDLSPGKWCVNGWAVYCSQECEVAADKAMESYFQSKINK